MRFDIGILPQRTFHEMRSLSKGLSRSRVPLREASTRFPSLRAGNVSVNFRGNFQTKRVERDKTGRVRLIVCLGWIRLHRSDIRIVERYGAFASGRDNVTLVKFYSHHT